MTERISRGILQINGTNYPIFDGLNPIGRFQKATVILKDTTISQSQAVIVIVNEQLHFISDTYSVNGTYLNRTRLVPLQLYELNDECALNFAGVRAVYKKVSNGETINEMTNGDVQECSQSVFGASTQLMESTVLTTQTVEESVVLPTDFVDIHEIETQSAANIHDLPTQVFQGASDETIELCSETTNISDVHDLPTQVLDTTVDSLPTSTVADDDPDATDDECENNVQNDSTVQPLTNNVIEDTVLEASKVEDSLINPTTDNSEDSNASLDLMLHDTQCTRSAWVATTNNIINKPLGSPSSTQESALKVGFLKKKASHRLKSDSDSETDVEADPKINASTDSDTEERLHLSQLRRRTRQLLQSDSEDEDVANVSNKNNTNNFSKLDDSDIIPSTQQFVDDKPFFSLQNAATSEGSSKTESITSQQSMENFKLGLTQFAKQICDNSDVTVADLEIQETSVVEEKLDNTALEKEVCVQPTQNTADADCSTQQIVGNSETFELQTQRIEVENVDCENVFLLPTQKMFTETNKAESAPREEPLHNREGEKDTTEDDVYAAPTQKICTVENTSDAEVDKQTEDDLFLMPTQRVASNSIENGEIYDTPTQKICVEKETRSEDVISMPTNSSENNEIYDAPTQKICTMNEEISNQSLLSNQVNANENDDLYDAPTQKICTKENSGNEEIDNQTEKDIFLMPTQRLVADNDDIYDAPTQKICTDETRREEMDAHTENDVFLMPTQQIVTTSSNIFDLPTQKICTAEEKASPQKVFFDATSVPPPRNYDDDIESQLEGIFKTQTVRYMESGAGRPGNPLAETFDKIEETFKEFHVTPNDSARTHEANTESAVTTKHEDKLKVSAESSSVSKKDLEENLCTSKHKSDSEKQEDTLEVSSRQAESSLVSKASTERNLRTSKLKLNTLEVASRQPETSERNLRTPKHKLENKTAVKNTKKIKLNSDVELESMDSLGEEGSNENATTTKPVVKKTVKSTDVSAINEEIKVTTVTRTRRTLSKFSSAPSNTSEVAVDKRKTRTCKTEETVTPSVSSPPPTKTAPKKSARNRASRKEKEEVTAEPSSESSVEEARTKLKRKTDSIVEIKTPVKRGRTRILQHVVSDSGSSIDAGSTPKSTRRTVLEANNTLNTPERVKRKQKPKVVFTMFESPELESSVRQLGGSMVDAIDSSTVLVTEHVRRTQKLLMAVGQGKPICSPDWIRKCKKASEFLDPWDHILVDKEAEKKWNFSLKESLNRSQSRKLLENYNVVLTVNNAVDVLKGAVEACGGKCFTKAPPKNLSGQLVVVALAENKSKYSKYLKQNPKPIIVVPEAIFDGVLRQELHFEDHLLE